jgi:hypothetical protein
MRHAATVLTVVLVVSLSTLPLAAATTVVGHVAGRELCPQSICGAAVFVGDFVGEINSRRARGTFGAGINYTDPLPTVEHDTTPITGGTFVIYTRRATVSGAVTSGEIEALAGNIFQISLTMAIDGGGTQAFVGILDHNVFPPTIVGEIQ